MNKEQKELCERIKKFKKWAARVEKKGIQKNGVEISIFGHNSNPFRRFTVSWWKTILYNITHRSLIDWFDYEDILKYLIINLTIKGAYLWHFGCHVTHRKQAHTCWLLRKDLLKGLGSAFDEEEPRLPEHTFVKLLLTIWD